MINNKKAIVAMSGGIDSSVTAYLVKEAGYETRGSTMRLCDKLEFANTTKKFGSDKDIADAKSVCETLDIPHDVLDFSQDFKKYVVENFVNSYIIGETPNPCIQCNKHIKFDKLITYSEYADYDKFATGHYAIIEQDTNGRYLIKKGLDHTKDQTYVLYGLTQYQLSKILFPLGSMNKTEVREIAREIGLINANRGDSQDICFVPDGDYASFIENYTGKTFPKGKFIDINGKVLGEHNGIIRYTIGQRKKLGIALGKPAFVCQKNIENNTVLISDDESFLFGKSLDASDINLIACEKITGTIECEAKIRYNQAAKKALVTQTSDNTIHVEFFEEQRAIAKGQSVVLYDGDTVIGGGIIR